MGSLIYSAITSLDGYVADEQGNFDWGEPDEEVHSFINALEREVGTHLYGRRMYEVMVAWETLNLKDQPPHMKEFAQIWRSADKVVYSKTLGSPPISRTRIERDFVPEAIRRMKAEAKHDLSVGGPELAAHALEADLVDECNLFLAPVVVGGGKQWLPTEIKFDLELRDERRFSSGFVYLGYRIRDRAGAP